MVLFLNVFITNERLVPQLYKSLDDQRKSSKLEVFKYTLASYAVIPWSKIIIYYELDQEYMQYREELRGFISDLFPKNLTIYEFRIDSYPEWQKALKDLLLVPDKWIWFSCNDDHVFIDSSLDKLESILHAASNKYKENKYISIQISHWQEYIAQKRRGEKVKKKVNNVHYGSASSVLEDNNEFYITDHRSCISIQILSKDLLFRWFEEPIECPPHGLRRTDSIIKMPQSQITIIPYKELVRHFDAYSHSGVSHKIVPPMFIPVGFFEKEIKIQYGGDFRSEGNVYIHPTKKMISNETVHSDRSNSNLCDSNIPFDDIPLFWRDRIMHVQKCDVPSDIQINSYIKQKIREVCADRRFGFNPFEAITHLEPVFKQGKLNPTREDLLLGAKNAWTFREFLYFSLLKFWESELRYELQLPRIILRFPHAYSFARFIYRVSFTKLFYRSCKTLLASKGKKIP